MSDRGSLMRAILVDPKCDTARLVYADWLEENGEDERAEFIRLQIRIGEIQRACGCGACVKLRGGGQHHNGLCGIDRERIENPDGTTRQAFIRRREHELFDRFKTRWFDERAAIYYLPHEAEDVEGQYPDLTRAIIRRGFVSSVRCRLADWVGGACGRCDGSGWERVADAAGDMDEIGCRLCGGKTNAKGTGRTPAHGPRIVAEQPVESLVLTCRNPLRFEARFLWHNAEHRLTSSGYDGDARPADHLPTVLFNTLTGNLQRPNSRASEMVKSYRDHASAMYALEQATPSLLNWARREAGLPPLPVESRG